MICPRCNTVLIQSVMQEVAIDHCPNCRGVWLDRGELEKIIERSNSYGSQFSGNTGNYYHNEHGYKKHHDDHDDDHHREHFDDHNGYGYPQKHRKGFLSDLFDF